MTVTHKASVACVRFALNDRTFKGCGAGWVQDADAPLICPTCGAVLRVTGTYKEVSLRRTNQTP